MAELELRHARQEDADTVYDLLCELEQDLETIDRKAFDRVYGRNVGRGDVRYLLAWMGETPVGFGSAHVQQQLHHTGPIAEVQELIATQAARGAGAGKALLRALESWAAQQGCRQIELCCRLVREHSNEFYERQGYAATHYKRIKEL